MIGEFIKGESIYREEELGLNLWHPILGSGRRGNSKGNCEREPSEAGKNVGQ